MTPRAESDEKYILDLVAQVLAEPDYRWQHRFPTLLGDLGSDGRQRPLPVDGYFPRHRLVVEYWEKQHSAPVPVMDEGMSVSRVSRGHQRRLYDQRRQSWAEANGLRLVILDYRGFEADELGRLRRHPSRDRHAVAQALRAAGILEEPRRESSREQGGMERDRDGCQVCRLVAGGAVPSASSVLWQDQDAIAFLSRCPLVYGHTLVAPTAHQEQVTGGLTLHAYLNLHRLVYVVAEAVRLALRPESVHIVSTGAAEPGEHLRWHILPLPPESNREQLLRALLELNEGGTESLPPDESERLAHRLQAHFPSWMRTRLAKEDESRAG